MITTTTNNIEGKLIREYKGILTAEVISAISYAEDEADKLMWTEESIKTALVRLQTKAEEAGANAIIGVKVDCSVVDTGVEKMLTLVSGTAVVAE